MSRSGRAMLVALLALSILVSVMSVLIIFLTDKVHLHAWAGSVLAAMLAGYFGWFKGQAREAK